MTVLRRALELPESERDAFVLHECSDDPDTRAHLQSVLSHSDSLPDFLATGGVFDALGMNDPAYSDPTPADTGQAADIPSDGAPHGSPEITGYRITGQLGAGGMGVVYSALQTSPQRTVAIKIIRGGSHVTPLQVRLFQREAQALARLRHPSIATIYEVGRTSRGEHFFVMEMVRGEHLTSFVHSLPQTGPEDRDHLRVRLGIFLKVVDAVAYAHQRGVIHRDIKPSNILVGRRPEVGSSAQHDFLANGIEVKLLDFGLARIADTDVQMTTMVTSAGNVLGTLAYMSPEQARGNPDDIDARSDLYSLGVLLHELLTDQLPIEIDGLPLHEAIRNICEQEPVRAGSIRKPARGDLETIIGKAIEKERDRRYQSSAALADDIHRYLDHQPILARPPSASYQLRKLGARYRMQAIFLVTLFVLAISSTIVMSFLWRGQKNERRHAEIAEAEQTAQLWESSLAQANATRLAGGVGRRFQALEAVERAAQIHASPKLRGEAIAAMAQIDLLPVVAVHELGLFHGSAASGTDGEMTFFGDPQRNGDLAIRESVTGDVLYTLPGHGRVLNCRFDAAGRFLAAKYINDFDVAPGEHTHTFRFWNVQKQELLIETPSTGNLTIDMSDDGKWLAAGNSPRTITIYSRDGDGTPEIFSTWETRNLSSVRFDPRSRYIALAGRGGVKVREVVSEELVWSADLPAYIFDVAWSSTGDRVAASCSARHVHVLDGRTGKELLRFDGHNNAATRVNFLHSNRWIVSSGWDNMTRIWDSQTEEQTIEIPGFLSGVARSTNRIATMFGNEFQFWKLSDARGLTTLPGHDLSVRRRGSLDFSPDGRWFTSAGDDGALVWDTASRQQVAQVETDQAWGSFFFRNDFLVTAGVHGVRKWPIRQGDTFQLEQPIPLPSGLQHVRSISLSEDGHRLAALDTNGRIEILYPEEVGRTLRVIDESPAWHVAIARSGSWIAAAGPKPHVMVWETEKGELLVDLPAPRTHGGNLAITPDEKWLILGTMSECTVWEVGTWQHHATFDRLSDTPFNHGHLAISPDSRTLAIATTNSVRLVALPDGLELASFKSPLRGSISALSFNRDGTKLSVGYLHSGVEVWDLNEIRTDLAELKLDWQN